MASVLVCDICKKEIKGRAGTITPMPFDGWGDGSRKLDLCLHHYNGMKNIMNKYVMFEQGFVVDWPQRTTT